MRRRFSKHLVEKKTPACCNLLIVSLQPGREHPQDCSLILQEQGPQSNPQGGKHNREPQYSIQCISARTTLVCLIIWLPGNFEQEKGLSLLPNRKGRRRAGFSISLFTFPNPGPRMGSEDECSGPKHFSLEQQELSARIMRSHTCGL